ncbi:MAG: hypothetical protein ABI779_17140 [Acidobacteriota bacterium]
MPQSDALIGDTVKFCVLFENDQGSPGFAPFLDLVFDQRGKDGTAGSFPCDGLTFVKAELLEVNPSPVPLPPVALPASISPCGNAATTHPFAASTAGWPAALNYPAGQQLVTLALPFGGFDQTQPPLRIEVTARVSSSADDGHPLSVRVRGGFRYGDDALNVAANQPVFDGPGASGNVLSWTTQTVTPRVLFLTTQFSGSEDEMVSGPNFPEHYTIEVHVAPGQVVNNLTLSDCASTDVIFTGITASGLSAIQVSNPNCFTEHYPSLSGPSSGLADTITAHFHTGNAPPLAGCSTSVTNQIDATAGTWQPLDPRDAQLNPVVASSFKTIEKKAIALTKSAQISPPGVAIPPAVVTYTLSFRISDYETFQDLVIRDTLSDGLVYVPNSATYYVTDQAHTASGSIPAKFVKKSGPVPGTFTCAADPQGMPCMPAGAGGPVTLQGSTAVTFLLSKLLGTVTGGGPTGATGSVTFQARIDPQFAHGPHSKYDIDQALDKEDPLLNHAEISGDRVSVSPPMSCGDDSDVCLVVPGDTFHKRIVAKNGVLFGTSPGPITVPLPQFQRGDTITYQLEKTIPSGNAEELVLKDWPPRPVLTVPSGIGLAVPLCSGQIGSQTVCYTATSPVSSPQVTTSTSENSFQFEFGQWSNLPNTPVTITLQITLPVSTAPFVDGLFLTNEAQECERNSYGTAFCQTAIAQFELTEPSLRIHKGILCPMGGCGKGSPGQATDPGQSLTAIDTRAGAKPPTAICTSPGPCPRFLGVVHSNNVTAFVGTNSQPPNVDAGDTIPFVIVVENVGHGPSGAYDIAITDLLPQEMSYVPNTLCVRRGDGASLPFVQPNGLFPLSLELSDGTSGALAPYSSTSGQNIAVITFDAKLKTPKDVVIGSCPRNVATLTSYSNQEQGANFVTAGFAQPFSSSAQVCVRPKEIVKQLITTSENHTVQPANAVWPLAVGEIVRFRLTVAVPEGNAGTFDVIDALPAGLASIGVPSIQTSAVATSMTWSSVTYSGPATWRFNKLVNSDNDADCELLIITFNALVRNVLPGTSMINNAGDSKTNGFSVWAGPTPATRVNIGTSAGVTARIVEPKLSIQKTVVADAGGVTYTVVVKNATPASTATAFDIVITDSPGTCLQILKTTVATSGGVTPPVVNGTKVTSTRMDIGGVITVTYRASMKCRKCGALQNTASVVWTSLPGTGTVNNPTGSVTPGPSGTVIGERMGFLTPPLPPENDYAARASVSLCNRVCGTKFSDGDGNGQWNPGEGGLSDWTITATDAAGNLAATDTVVGGGYCFDLPPGTYTFCEKAQPKWHQTFPTQACHTVNVSPGGTVPAQNFGNQQCGAQVCGRKWEGKPGVPLAGWKVTAQPTTGGPAVSALTNADGAYCLDLTGPGSYTITEEQKPGWVMTAPAVPYVVTIECQPSPGRAFMNGLPITTQSLDFTNENLCARLNCPKPSSCQVVKGVAQCLTMVPWSPCDLVKCASGTQCKVVQGLPKCVP